MTELVYDNSADIAMSLINEILEHGNTTERYVGPWCMKTEGISKCKELSGVSIELTDPKNCITSQHTLACEIETEDYILGLNPGYIEYSDWSFYKKFKVSDKYPYTYGERLYNPLAIAIDKLRKYKTSRQVVISAWDNEKDMSQSFVPCNTTFKLEISNDKLNMFVFNRSQDACRGIFLDTFAYPMMQQIAATQLGLKLGSYYHYIANAHVYNDDIEFAKRLYDSLVSLQPLEICDKLTLDHMKTMKEVSELIFIKKQTQTASFVAKKLPEFWYNWKLNQIVYGYTKYNKKDVTPVSLTCVGVVINENPGKM